MGNKRKHGRVVSCDFTRENEMAVPSLVGKDSYRWSFSKEKRFRMLRPTTTEEMYNLPQTFSNRAPSFGYGGRLELKNKQGRDSPSPCAYNPPSCFEIEKRAPTFGRRSMSGAIKNIPGPGAYNPYSPIGSKAPKFTFFSRIELKHKAPSPPPDIYNPKFSLIEKSSFSNISFGVGEKKCTFIPKFEEIPGPGTYDLPSVFRSNLSFDSISNSKSVTPNPTARRSSTKALY